MGKARDGSGREKDARIDDLDILKAGEEGTSLRQAKLLEIFTY